jgi:hypothetical protein
VSDTSRLGYIMATYRQHPVIANAVERSTEP